MVECLYEVENMAELGKKRLTLRVSETLAKDVSRGIARIDPKDMAEMDAEVGDIIQILGKRPAVAKVMPAYMEDRGKEVIQIDGITRENAQIGLGEKAQVEKMDYKTATNVFLAPIAPSSTFARGKDSGYIGRLLEGLAVTSGDKVRVTLFGTRYQEFSVLDNNPKGVVVIQPTTLIKMKGERVGEKEDVRDYL